MKRFYKKISIGIVVITLVIITAGFQSKFFEVAKQIDIFTTMFKELNMYYIDEINPADLMKHAVENMLETLDPYTRYYDEQGVEDARVAATGEFGGIGALSKFKNNSLQIREIIKNTPAEKAGLKPGDNILKIDNIVVAEFNEKGANTLINGLPGSEVKLEIQRLDKTFEVELVRKKIELNPVPYYTKLKDNVGYISFTTFNEKAAKKVKDAFMELKEEGIKSLIIDVRGNPGGLLNEAVKITNFFIPKDKIVVTTKAKIQKWSDIFKTKNEPIDVTMPIAILIDNYSASASEILAGALQDYDRAVIIGERSFGKGLVQRYRELSYGTQMKITISKYYTPSGRNIQKLDYTNRDKDGNVPEFSDKGSRQFKTLNGRAVFGGGGIRPDIDLKKGSITKTTETLLNSDALFNYVTHYFYKNATIANPTTFQLSNVDYYTFKNYLNANHVDFKTELEMDFEKAMQKDSEDNLVKNLDNSYSALTSKIQEEKLKELDKNKEEIINKLSEEIIKRYYYTEGVYKHKAVFDQEILKAVEILNNSKKYNQILNN